ncbi:hypothetical protein HY500_02295 [Candidatus Woesearchaeota archaeon]|nr:hypothetical protein [Candidatus Woesearchaeota archaeon]
MALVVSLIAVLLFLSGCGGNLRFYQKISSNGTVSGYMSGTLDLTELYAQQGIPQESYAAADAEFKTSMCEGFLDSSNLTNVECDLKYAMLIFSGNTPSEHINESNGFFIKKGFFVTEYLFAPNTSKLISGGNSSQINMSDLAKEQNLRITFVAEMPGEIYDVEGGQIINDSSSYKKVVEINLMDAMIQGNPISIKSREINSSAMAAIAIILLLIIIVLPFLRLIVHRKQEKSQYKDKPGTVLFMLFTSFFIILFVGAIGGYFSSDGNYQIFLAFVIFLYSMGFIIVIFQYTGADFEVAENGITYKNSFVKKNIPFSEIKKIEIAKLKTLWAKRGNYIFMTPSGEEVKPNEIVQNVCRYPNKGILIFLKNGRIIFYNIKDINWVIEATKTHI